jgi:hypothetical protein
MGENLGYPLAKMRIPRQKPGVRKRRDNASSSAASSSPVKRRTPPFTFRDQAAADRAVADSIDNVGILAAAAKLAGGHPKRGIRLTIIAASGKACR